MQRQYHVLTGPTAAGKTGFLLERAASRPMLVISADSRQVYRMLDIGTGKPTAEELARLPHYGLDILELGSKFSVYRFLIMLAGVLRTLHADPRQVWICGGTGLYIHALLQGLSLGAPPREQLRLRLTELMASDSAARWAGRLELELAEADNPVRVLRAAEQACADAPGRERIYPILGLKPDADNAGDQAGSAAFEAAMLELQGWSCAGLAVLDPGREALRELIASRVRSMFEAGLPEEVQRIREAGYGEVDEVASGIAYREAGLLLDGALSYEEALQRSINRTRQYAKRQRTYFRGRGWQFMQEHELADWFDALA